MSNEIDGLKMGIEMLDNTMGAVEQIVTSSALFSPYLHARGEKQLPTHKKLTEEELQELFSILGRLVHMEARLSWMITRLS